PWMLSARRMDISTFTRFLLGGFALVIMARVPVHAESPAEYGCDRPVHLAYYEFGPLYHGGVGIDRDVVEELGRRAGWVFETALKPRAQIWQELQDDKLDMATSGLRTDARNQFAYFVPYLGMKNVFIAEQSIAGGIESFDDVVGNPHLKIGVVKGYIHGAYF